MTSTEFLSRIEKIYKRYIRITYQNVSDIQKDNFELIEYLVNNYDDLLLTIHINNYEIKGKKVIFKTNIGTFLTDTPKFSDELSKYANIDIDACKFFETFIIKKSSKLIEDIKDENSKIFIKYLQSYYLYRNLTDPNEKKRHFSNFSNDNYNCSDKVFTLECLNNPNFFDLYAFTPHMTNYYIEDFVDIYDNYFKFDNNKNILFANIILSGDASRKSFILENISEFKEFIINYVSNKAKGNSYVSLAYKYISENSIIDYFEQDELEKMYLKNPYYYILDSKRFESIALNIKNSSPLIKLDNETEDIIHVRVRDYDLIDDIPFEYYKKQPKTRENMNFKNTFLFNNTSILKFYKIYYRSYIDIINRKNLKNKDNLKDFIRFLFEYNNLMRICNNPNITINDLKSLEMFLKFYDIGISDMFKRIKKDLRYKALRFHNEIVNSKDSINEINSVLCKYKVDKDNIYSFIINNKFLYVKEKSALINIIGVYYDLSVKFIDVLSILNEMLDRRMTIDQILKEKGIPKKEFDLIYEKSAKDNPILHEYISNSLKRNKRLGFMKLCKYGYVVLKTNITSIKDYEEKFKDHMSYYDLIKYLSKTDISDKLIEKAQSFNDFNKDYIDTYKKKN